MRQQCNDIPTGHVEVPGESYNAIQNAVYDGINVWRLNPLETAKRVGIKHFGFSERDHFKMKGYFVEKGTELPHATVWANHNRCWYVLELYQPRRQGPHGIWVLYRIAGIADPYQSSI